MAIDDSLQQLIATQRAANRFGGRTGKEAAALKESSFAPVIQQLRKLVGGIDERYVKHKLTRSHAVIRIGQKSIDLGWDVVPNPALSADAEAPPIKVVEARNFMRDDRTESTLWFTTTGELVAYLEREILRQIAHYTD